MEKVSYIESEDKLVIETIYDPTPTIELAAELRQRGDVTVGSKGQEMLLAAVIDLDHITALKNEGYDLMSADPDERRRTLVYIQNNQQKFMATDRNVFARTRPKWQ